MSFDQFGINIKGKTSGQIKTTCPQCSESRKKKKDPCLSVDIDRGVWCCHNCGWKGSLPGTKPVPKKEYSKPVPASLPLSEKTIQWFKGRKISINTLQRFNVTEEVKMVPQAQKERTCICFNYYRDGELVNIKYRDGKKNFFMVGGAELIFYGLDDIGDKDEVIICEGEIDKLSFYEAMPSSPCLSVPNGASKGSMKLEYFDNCHGYFEKIKTVYLATDTDEPGIALRDELARRIGRDKCMIISYPEGCKDANEVLMMHGSMELVRCVADAKPYPIEGVWSPTDVVNGLNHLYEFGFPKGEKIGYPNFDTLMSFRSGELTLITGIPNSGKSEFMDQVFVRLASRSGWKFGIFSAENQPVSFHVAKLAEKFTGEPFFTKANRMTQSEKDTALDFINEHFFFLRIDVESITIDYLLEKARELVISKGINAFVLDPWNRVEHAIPKGMSETQYINDVLTKIYRFKEINDVHFFMVAHPTKIKKDKNGNYEVATMYDISGSAHFFNKSDNGMSVYRDFQTNDVYVYIQKIRWKFIGRIGSAEFDYDLTTGRYKEQGQIGFERETEIKKYNPRR